MKTIDDTSTVMTGKALDTKAGAVLVTDDQHVVYVEGLDYWPEEFVGERVTVSGLLRRKKTIPDPSIGPNGAYSQGVEGKQLVLEEPRWQRAD